MKVINCFVLSISLFIAGCGNIDWFPENKTGKFPNLTKAFNATSTPIIGSPVTLTFTIDNPAGNPAQSGLGFTESLPTITKTNGTFGMFVANPPNASTTCGGNIYTGGTTNSISAGDTALTFSGGTIGEGPATCTVSVQVTSNAATTNLNLSFINGFNNISNVTSNLNNNVSDQLLAFSPVTQAITGGTLSARDLVVSPNGSPQFSLFIDNSSSISSANVTVTVTGKDSSGTAVSTVTVPALPFPVAAGKVGQQLTLSGVTVDSTVKTWQISSINITS
ncbi:MAG TPA: hypothetical protein VHN12_12350 [Geobacteraceae bacterium]|nr:hypothetical protein [Geobacteraceae bacterium]